MGRPVSDGRGGRAGASPSDRLVVIRRLGRGGQGEVSLARRTSDGRLVAMKTLHGAEPEARARLAREARVLKKLARHPGVVSLVEDHSAKKRPFIPPKASNASERQTVSSD